MTKRQLNIFAVYSQATAAEQRAGIAWYADAHAEAKRLAKANDLTLHQTSAVIAALSPGLRWERNIEAAERLILGESLDGLGIRWYDGVRKAKKILMGADPNTVLRGNKVRAFWACIESPAKSLSVCIDGHAYSIWAGRRITLDEIPPINNRLYNRLSADYTAVALEIGISAPQLQAITWVAWRRIHEV